MLLSLDLIGYMAVLGVCCVTGGMLGHAISAALRAAGMEI